MSIRFDQYASTPGAVVAALKSRERWYRRRRREFRLSIPKLLDPRGVERAYQRDLLQVMGLLSDLIDRILIPQLDGLLRNGRRELGIERFDAFDDELTAVFDLLTVEFARIMSDDEIKRISRRRARETSEFNRKQNDKVFRSVLGLDIFRNEPYLAQQFEVFASENATLIKSLSSDHIKNVEGIVKRAVRNGFSAQVAADEIRTRFGVTKSRATLIARDQIGKLNGQLTRTRQQAVGITRYRWRTSLDERVRQNHRAKEGRLFSWDNPPADTGHPGEDIQCRCYAEPVLEDLVR